MPPGKPDIKVTASDALEFEPVSPAKRRTRRGLRLFLLLLLIAGGGGGWVVYGDQLMVLIGDTASPVPVVRAAAGPVKVRPENPGGLNIPDRDKLVYNRIQGGLAQADGGTVERLLPPPEAPLPKPQAIAGLVAEKNAEKNGTTPEPEAAAAAKVGPPPPKPESPKTIAKVPTAEDVATAERPVPPEPPPPPPQAPDPGTQAKSTVTAQPPPPPVPVKSVETAELTPAAKTPPPAKKEPTAEAAAAAKSVVDKPFYRVQLAAARSPEGAKQEWIRIRRKNLDLLGNLGLTVTKADLGTTRGIFYRLRVGPLADEKAARELCATLTKRRVGCLVIKPGG